MACTHVVQLLFHQHIAKVEKLSSIHIEPYVYLHLGAVLFSTHA